jgi:Protein of unknown function (DUF3037)
VPVPSSFDYAVVRVVPRVDRGEYINAGVVLYCLEQRFLGALVELDEGRLLALAPEVDLTLVRTHLEALPRICQGGAEAGPIGQLPQKERWHWLVAPRSTILQMSPVHSGLCEDPGKALEHLMDSMVRAPAG